MVPPAGPNCAAAVKPPERAVSAVKLTPAPRVNGWPLGSSGVQLRSL